MRADPRFAVALLLVSLTPFTARGEVKKYGMKDLQALAKAQSYDELLAHLEDVAPSERGKTWDELVEKAACGALNAHGGKDDTPLAMELATELPKRYPALKSSKAFAEKRRDVGLKYGAMCFDADFADQHCVDTLTGLLDAAPDDRELAFAAGKLVIKRQNHYVAVPYFARAVKGGGGKTAAYCGDEALGRAVIAGLGLPPDDAREKQSVDVAGTDCFTQLKGAVAKAVEEGGPEGYLAGNACPVLKAKGALAGKAAEVCGKVKG